MSVHPRDVYPSSEEVRMLVQDILKRGGNLRLIAEDAGVSYKAVLAWSAGTRTPQPDSLQRLAEGMRKRAQEMVHDAERLERAAGKAA